MLLGRLLDSLENQELDYKSSKLSIEIIVVDNDPAGSGSATVQKHKENSRYEIKYAIEPKKCFATIRNKTLQLSEGSWIAFIDDDERAPSNWLVSLLTEIEKNKSDGALGPVRPYFDTPPPNWLVKSEICERPEPPTGTLLDYTQTRTGNALINARVFKELGLSFDTRFASGGEDVDFFKRAMAKGCKFTWTNDAAVYELVTPDRMKLSFHTKRKLLEGYIATMRHHDKFVTRLKKAAKNVVAIIAYALLLPVFFILRNGKDALFLIKICHHLGQFSSRLGIPLVKDRTF